MVERERRRNERKIEIGEDRIRMDSSAQHGTQCVMNIFNVSLAYTATATICTLCSLHNIFTDSMAQT